MAEDLINVYVNLVLTFCGVSNVIELKRLLALCLLPLATLVIYPTTASAQWDQLSPAARELLSISTNPSSDFSQAGRNKFLRAVTNYCREFLAILPTNSPKEEAWVASEIATSDEAKIKRLIVSPEFSRQTLKETFSSCENTANKIIDTFGRDRTDNLVRYEAANLVSLAAILNNTQDIEIYASKAGMDSQRLGLELLGSVRQSLLFAAMRTLEGN